MRDEVSAEQPSLTLDPRPIPSAQRPMFGATARDGEYEALPGPADAGPYDEPAGRGMSTWVAAAASLIIGILIGFASGYTAAQPDEPVAAIVEPEADPAPAPVRDPEPGSSTQTFTEDKVDRVDPDPIVAGAEPEPARGAAPRAAAPPAARSTAPATSSRPAAPPAGRTAAAPPPVRGEARDAERRAPAVNTGAAQGRGSMEVVSRPAGAQVVLDGLVIGKTPMVLPEVPSGTHAVRLELPGFQRWATSVDVNPGQRTRVAASLEQ